MADNEKLDLGRFEPQFLELQRNISAAAEKDRWQVFTEASYRIASWMTQGLDRGMASDAIYEIAARYSVGRMDDVQMIMADAFTAADEIERVPDEETVERINGYHPNAPKLEARKPKEKTEPLPPILNKRAFLDAYGRPPDYLVDDILQKGFLYSLTGLTGHFKTAIALLIAQLVASDDGNATLGRHRVHKGRVLYFSGENPNDVSWRVMGADYVRRQDGEDPSTDNISFIAGGFDVDRMLDVIAGDAKKNGAIALIVVDTSAVFFKGRDENDNVSAGNHARMLRKLTLLPGRPCVFVLSHPAKSVSDWTQLQPRGGGAFVNEVDGNLTCWKTTDRIAELNFLKLRGPTFQPIQFEIMDCSDPNMKDTQDRPMKTVRAQVIGAEREEAVAIRVTEETQQLIVAMAKRPVDLPPPEKGSIRKWAIDCGWLNEVGEPLHGRVSRLLAEMVKEEKRNRLVERNKYKQFVLTKQGLDEAQKLDKAMQVAAAQEAERAGQKVLDFKKLPPVGRKNNMPDEGGDGGLDG